MPLLLSPGAGPFAVTGKGYYSNELAHASTTEQNST